jgi:hypothetical protein
MEGRDAPGLRIRMNLAGESHFKMAG